MVAAAWLLPVRLKILLDHWLRGRILTEIIWGPQMIVKISVDLGVATKSTEKQYPCVWSRVLGHMSSVRDRFHLMKLALNQIRLLIGYS